VPSANRELFPWIVGKITPAAERAEAWRNRGGPLGRGARRIGEFTRSFAGKVKRRVRRMLGS